MKGNRIVVLCTIILMFILALVSCTDKVSTPKFTFNDNVSEDIRTILAGTDKGYNTQKGEIDGIYSAEEFSNLVEGFTFYVPVGKSKYDKINEITIGNLTVRPTSKVKVSMGNSRYVEDYIFLYKEGNLYIAAPVLLFETMAKPELTINGDVYKTANLQVSSETEVVRVFWNNGSSNDVIQEDDIYTAVFNEDTATSLLEFELKDNADHYLTKKTYFQDEDFIKTEYEYIGAVTESEKKALGLYPLGWNDIDLPEVEYDSIEYSACLFDTEGNMYHKDILINISIPEYLMSKTILSDIEKDMLNFAKGYNKPSGEEGKRYNADEFKELVPDFTFYTEIGKVREGVESIAFDSDDFNEDDNVEVYIGTNCIIDRAFKVVDDKLYVATPIIAFELLLKPELTVYGWGWEKTLEFNIPDILEAKLMDVQWQSGSTNTVTRKDSIDDRVIVDVKVNDPAYNKWLGFLFQPQSGWYLTQKLYLDENGELLNVAYDYNEAQILEEGKALTIYPMSNRDSEVSEYKCKSIECRVVFANESTPYRKTLVIRESKE